MTIETEFPGLVQADAATIAGHIEFYQNGYDGRSELHMRDRQLRHFGIRRPTHLVLMLEIILAGGNEFARPRYRRE